MLWCWTSRDNNQCWGLIPVRKTHVGCNYWVSIYLLLSFFFFFFLFHSEVHERSHPLCEERLSSFRNWVGDASSRISPLGLRLCRPPVAAFALHPQRQEDNTAQDVLCDAQHDGVRPREQVSGGFARGCIFAFALDCRWPFQHWVWWARAGNGLWPHTATRWGASDHRFGKGGWWCLSREVLDSAFGLCWRNSSVQ